MNTRLFFVGLLAVCACKSEKKAAFEKLAAKINPVLVTLRPAASAVLSLASEEELRALSHAISEADTAQDTLPAAAEVTLGRARQLDDACKTGDEALWSLRSVDFHAFCLKYELGVTNANRVANYATDLLDLRPKYCRREEHGESHLAYAERVAFCANFCREHFKLMSEGLVRLRDEAAKEDVEIVSFELPSSPRGSEQGQ